MTRPCVTCGVELHGVLGRLPPWQCGPCKRRAPMPPRCAVCGQDFTPARPNSLYCRPCSQARRDSQVARQQWHRRRKRRQAALDRPCRPPSKDRIADQIERHLADIRQRGLFRMTDEHAWYCPVDRFEVVRRT